MRANRAVVATLLGVAVLSASTIGVDWAWPGSANCHALQARELGPFWLLDCSGSCPPGEGPCTSRVVAVFADHVTFGCSCLLSGSPVLDTAECQVTVQSWDFGFETPLCQGDNCQPGNSDCEQSISISEGTARCCP